MYPVAHITAAVGGVWLGERLLKRFGGAAPAVASRVDFRWVAAGALLPDLIDKPLARAGIEALSYDQTAGHNISHTLILGLGVIAVGSVVERRGDGRLLWMGLGSVTHLVVDPVIAYPGVLLWPLFGLDFPESKGIPSWPYLIGFDVLVVAAGALAYEGSWQFRELAWGFLRRGEVSLGGAAVSDSRERSVAAGRGASRGS